MGAMSSRTELRIPAGTIGPALARAAVPNVLPPLRGATIADLQLLVSELVSDAIQRSGISASQDVRIVVVTVDARIRIEVGIAGGTPRPVPGGWATLLLDRLALAWGYEEVPAPARIWFDVAHG
jgi:hypothetical protein